MDKWSESTTYTLDYSVAYSTSTTSQEFINRSIQSTVTINIASMLCQSSDQLNLPIPWPEPDSVAYYYITGQAQVPVSTYNFQGAFSSPYCDWVSSLSPLSSGAAVFSFDDLRQELTVEQMPVETTVEFTYTIFSYLTTEVYQKTQQYTLIAIDCTM